MIDLKTCINNELLISVDDGSLLKYKSYHHSDDLLCSCLTGHTYPVVSGKPILLRSSFPLKYILNGIPHEFAEDSYQQYMLLSQIEASVSTNLDKSCEVYQHTETFYQPCIWSEWKWYFGRYWM